ncbi:hypothetical protein ABZW47_06450 [Streptomyces sp. NPDC004549]|uniref:hypothetical protein n=1 Tax=Streptomyces sp. NPDC004549 TaxID=3154283 RepID=UPI0033A86337
MEDFRCAADCLVTLDYKELLVIPDVSHYDLYDKPEAVQPALDALIPFFHKHL